MYRKKQKKTKKRYYIIKILLVYIAENIVISFDQSDQKKKRKYKFKIYFSSFQLYFLSILFHRLLLQKKNFFFIFLTVNS